MAIFGRFRQLKSSPSVRILISNPHGPRMPGTRSAAAASAAESDREHQERADDEADAEDRVWVVNPPGPGPKSVDRKRMACRARGRGAAPDLLAQARQARPRRRHQQGKRATGEGACRRTSNRFARPPHFNNSLVSAPCPPGDARITNQGGLRQLRAAAEVAQGVGPKRCAC